MSHSEIAFAGQLYIYCIKPPPLSQGGPLQFLSHFGASC